VTFHITVHHRLSVNLDKSQHPVSTSQHPMSNSIAYIMINF